MKFFFSTERVQLAEELDKLQLHKGDLGVVRNSWHYPTVAYEVEFKAGGQPVRVLLLDHQIQAERRSVNYSSATAAG